MQALARAQRIGQTKQVVCIRYIMERTIEQVLFNRLYSAYLYLTFSQSDVMNRQMTKTLIARGGFIKQGLDKSLVGHIYRR